MTQGTDSMSYRGKGYMAWGLAGPLSMMGYPLAYPLGYPAYHDGSGDPVPNPDPFKPSEESWLLLSTTKKAPGTPGNRQLWPAAGDTYLTDLSLNRDWSRPFLALGTIERTCLQAGGGGLVAGQP